MAAHFYCWEPSFWLSREGACQGIRKPCLILQAI
jgi:hypothetical protein